MMAVDKDRTVEQSPQGKSAHIEGRHGGKRQLWDVGPVQQ